MKTCYLFDETGLYVGIYQAQESPLEHGKFIAPATSTFNAPPTLGSNQAAVFLLGSWTIVPDFRGEKWYNQSTGEEILIASVGQPPSSLAATPPPPTLSQAQAAQLELLNAAYNVAIQQEVSYLGTTFQADIVSQDTLNKVLVAANVSVPNGFYWVDANNNQVSLNYVQLQGLAAVMLAQGWTAFQHLQTQKAAVRAATTVKKVQAITW